MLQHMLSGNGKLLIFYEGHKHNCPRPVNKPVEGLSWRCCKKTCQAKIFTNQDGTVLLLRSEKSHNHPKAATSKIHRQMVANMVRQKALECGFSKQVSVLINEEMARVPREVAESISSRDIKYIRDKFYIAKKKKGAAVISQSKGTSNEAKTTTLSTPTSHDLPPSTSSAPASHDLPPSTLAHSTLHNWYTDEPESHQPCTDESSTYQHQSPPREDISEVNIQIKQEQEDSYLDELHTGENIANDGEESSIAFSEQMFPEMPGGVMQDTFEMFSRYMTSILRQLPVTKSYSLQQQFINEAINAKLEYEKQHPSKSPQRDCFSPLPPPPVYTTITEPTKDKPPAKRGRKRKGNNSTVSEGPSDSITQHLYPSNIKRELTNDIDFSGDIIEGQETTAALVLGGCHSEMDFEEDPEFKPDVKTPFEMVLCSEPLESVCSTPKTQKKLGKCPQSSEALDQLNRHIDERNPDTNHAKATKTGQKKKRLEEHNQTSTSVSSISLPVNKDKLEPNTRIPANLQVASHPQPASHLPLVQFPPVQNPQLFRLLMPNVTSTTVMNTDSQPIPSQPSNLNNT